MSKIDIREYVKEFDRRSKEDPSNKALSWLRSIFTKLPEHQLDSLNYFDEIMNECNDLTLIVLRGHLLIEQQIQKIFSANFGDNIYKEIKFDSHTLITLIEALYRNKKNFDNRIWKSVKKLNNIRNDLAHNIENPGLEDKINDLISFENRRSSIEINIDGELASKLKTTIYGMSAVIISITSHAVEDLKKIDKVSGFLIQFNNNYTKLINDVEEIKSKRNGKPFKEDKNLNKFSDCFNESYEKIYFVFINTLDEYLASTYGALLAAQERVEIMEKDDIVKSLNELKSDHGKVLTKMQEFFIEKYSELIEGLFSKLKDTLGKEIDALIVE